MNKYCTLITTQEAEDRILKLILDEDNTFAPMGSGGYKIKEDKEHRREFRLISFVAQDRTPSGTHFVFLKDGKMWATYMAGWMVTLLCNEGISFASEQVENPAFIEEEMTEKSAK